MIIKLHDNLINKIAAGEVVERPASVLKELIENSIDAKAKKITVNIKKAGVELIEVEDNGAGMSKEDAKIACDSHTTSKITTVQDLGNIFTMGFRGEALASIASVSKLTLETKRKSDKTGTKITVEYGKKKKVEDISKNKGTKVTVEQLFHNIPARKKFLKSKTTEYKHILVTFINYALAYPNIHFSLSHNNKNVYNLPSIVKDNFNEELKDRLNDLLGSKILGNLVGVSYNSPYLQIFGLIGHPKSARARKSYQSTFLNKRPISDKLIPKAVYDAYHGLIPRSHYPIFFLFLKLEPGKVDVNVHPRKAEVRFSDTNAIYQAVKQASKQSILKFLQKEAKEALKEYPAGTGYIPSKSIKTQYFASHPQKGSVKTQHFASHPKKRLISESLSFTKELLKSKKPVGTEYIPVQTQDFASPPQTSIETQGIASRRSFQFFNTYIIIEKDDKLIFIDQHAAAERVTYEKLNKQFKNDRIETQKLLIPEVIELNKLEFGVLKNNRNNLSKLGITLSIFGKSAFKVEEIPALIAKTNIKELINDIVSELIDHETAGVADLRPFNKIRDHIIATMACHSSIRAGMKLERAEISNLIDNLLKCENPHSCPHGRPIMWEITRSELEGKFGRH